MSIIPGSLSHFRNPQASAENIYSNAQQNIICVANSDRAVADISLWPGYKPTDLQSFTSLANTAGVAKIWYKNEAQRFDLKSFKALGGAYAVARQLQQAMVEKGLAEPSIADLLAGKCQADVSELVVSCATDGNHGRSVAWGAQIFGCHCVIYIHRDVSIGRQTAMESFGAKVVRITGNYDESVRMADKEAKANQRIIVSDTSYPGYMEIPKDVALGYTVMLAEIVEQLAGDTPTHVFIQGGVGGLASAVCGYFWDLWGNTRPRFVVVEPEQANCLQESAKAGKATAVTGDLDTLMAGLACGEVSSLAWEILENGADDFLTISEDSVAPTMKMLATGYKNDAPVEAGESAVPGLSAAVIAAQSAEFSAKLGLNQNSKILVIGTEGATDPELYKQLIS
ncbi:MAG: diaminopropionate ammonia-lyase [Oceanospirillaceae bacterium]